MNKSGSRESAPDSNIGPTPLSVQINRQISRTITDCIEKVATQTDASAIFVYAHAVPDSGLRIPEGFKPGIFFLTKTPDEEAEQKKLGHKVIRVPNVSLARFSQMKIALLLALSHGLIKLEDVVICLSGPPDSGSLDTITAIRVGAEFEEFLTPTEGKEGLADVEPEVLERVINIAAELGREGREGRPIGAIFVIGDSDRVLTLSRQLILNPFRGYSEKERNILDSALEETIKELAFIDGAFVITRNGIVESAGTYLKAASPTESRLPPGLGARHHAAAAITSLCDAVAVTVSQSTGTVTVFRHGHIVTELEKIRSSSPHKPEESP